MSELTNSLINQALKIQALRNSKATAEENLTKFEHRLVSWSNQLSFSWGGVNLTITPSVAEAIRFEMKMAITQLNEELAETVELFELIIKDQAIG